MYKVMIFDDEIWVIRGLLKAIPWEEMGFKVVFYSTNSIEAHEKICQLQPDLILSDIKMPGVSGIELLEQTQQLEKAPRVILISAYAEFEYAHKALRYGAFDYLIKPLKKEDIIRTLDNIKVVLDQDFKQPGQLIEEQLFLKREKISAKNLFAHYQVMPKGPQCCVIACAKQFFDADHVIYHTIKEMIPTTVQFENEYFAFVLMDLSEPTQDNILKIRQIADTELVYLGLSHTFCIEGSVNLYLEQAEYAALQFMIHSDTNLSTFLEMKYIEQTRQWKEAITAAIEQANGTVLNSLVRALPENLSIQQKGFYDFVEAANYIVRELERYSIPISRAFHIDSVEDFLSTHHHVTEYFIALQKEIATLLDDKQQSVIDVATIEKYIDQNYTKIQSISDIAERFHVDLAYLSRIFKQAKGENIKSYLTAKKMERAKYLLLHTDLKIYEVTDAVGYSDYFYFTKAFRKIVGKTPTQFRETHGRGES